LTLEAGGGRCLDGGHGGHGGLGGIGHGVAILAEAGALGGARGIAGRRTAPADAIAGLGQVLADRGDRGGGDLTGGVRQACLRIPGAVLGGQLTGLGGEGGNGGATTEGRIGMGDHGGRRDLDPSRATFDPEPCGGGRKGVAGGLRLLGGLRRHP
jgi:hypothetical protein